ncbi:putative iron-regulated protein [Shimia isoporae]|uniref:Putative iron-regulated protein n=1 Tax=Shimia isoporae TaxID=647720 RepID=A0A4R1NLL6_9RHOB|nr:ChaN family lipoprotein [Shimia isoporae]TCL08601.1 putative iron-regulated protein [Shimia isoporae]
MKTFFTVTATALMIVPNFSIAKEISAKELTDLPSAQVVFLGEVHDNPHHHDNQAVALAALRPAAVVFEMLTPDAAQKVTPELMNDESGLREALDWDNSGWPDFAMYFPVFSASAGAAIFGAQVPRSSARDAVMGGDVASAFGDRAGEFGLLDALPSEQQTEREAKQMAAHCDALPAEMLPGMVLAQRLRDATLARAAVEALEATGGPVAVVTGNGHARTDWGASALIGKNVSVLSIGQFEAAPDASVPYDFWLVTEAAEREDPCAAFR